MYIKTATTKERESTSKSWRKNGRSKPTKWKRNKREPKLNLTRRTTRPSSQPLRPIMKLLLILVELVVIEIVVLSILLRKWDLDSVLVSSDKSWSENGESVG